MVIIQHSGDRARNAHCRRRRRVEETRVSDLGVLEQFVMSFSSLSSTRVEGFHIPPFHFDVSALRLSRTDGMRTYVAGASGMCYRSARFFLSTHRRRTGLQKRPWNPRRTSECHATAVGSSIPFTHWRKTRISRTTHYDKPNTSANQR